MYVQVLVACRMSEEKGRLSQSEIDRMVQEAEPWAQ